MIARGFAAGNVDPAAKERGEIGECDVTAPSHASAATGDRCAEALCAVVTTPCNRCVLSHRLVRHIPCAVPAAAEDGRVDGPSHITIGRRLAAAAGYRGVISTGRVVAAAADRCAVTAGDIV